MYIVHVDKWSLWGEFPTTIAHKLKTLGTFTLLENFTDDAITLLCVTNFLTIFRYLTKFFVT